MSSLPAAEGAPSSSSSPSSTAVTAAAAAAPGAPAGGALATLRPDSSDSLPPNRKRASDNDDNDCDSKNNNQRNTSPCPAKRVYGAAPERSNSQLARTAMEESLRCSVCIDLFHQPVSLDCMHTYCGGCWSVCSKRSARCPTCRAIATKAKPNFVVQGMVDAWLQLHPDRRRTAADLADLENNNTYVGGGDVVRPDGSGSDYEIDDEGESDYEDEEEVDANDQPAGPICGHCPGGAVHSNDDFRCPEVDAEHLYCHACHRTFPKREGYPQKCGSCAAPFCNAYWEATSGQPPKHCDALPQNLLDAESYAYGQLRPACDYKCPTIPDCAFSQNNVERDLLKLQLQTKISSSMEEAGTHVWKTALDGIREGTFSPRLYPIYSPFQQADAPCMTDVNTLLCGICAKRIHGDAMEWYRKQIPRDELLPVIRNRRDCWYGKDCRTQYHNLAHAQKLNHVCENTKANGGVSSSGPAAGSSSSSA
ncbi:hypothetical protein HDU88_007340 [Geranomyces variabilis]|nr:hypothetical protein HDU88_007340 [Geranomyces variabilis]